MLGKMRLQAVRPEHIQRFYNKLDNEGFAKSTVEINASILSNMFKQAGINRAGAKRFFEVWKRYRML